MHTCSGRRPPRLFWACGSGVLYEFALCLAVFWREMHEGVRRTQNSPRFSHIVVTLMRHVGLCILFASSAGGNCARSKVRAPATARLRRGPALGLRLRGGQADEEDGEYEQERRENLRKNQVTPVAFLISAHPTSTPHTCFVPAHPYCIPAAALSSRLIPIASPSSLMQPHSRRCWLASVSRI